MFWSSISEQLLGKTCNKHCCVAFVLIKLVSTIFSLLCIRSLFQSHGFFFCRFADFRFVEIMLERYRTVHVHHPGFNEDVNKFTVRHHWDLETLLVFQEYHIGSNIDYRSKYSMIYSEANVQSKPESDSISHQRCSHEISTNDCLTKYLKKQEQFRSAWMKKIQNWKWN